MGEAAFVASLSNESEMPYNKRKVYWKGLRLVEGAVKRYIERNLLGLEANLTTEQMACVTAVLNAIIECLNILPVNTPNGS